ncbi:MAG: HNH endonuclease signature motif containing protein, partial [Specibacter sp.]
DNPRTNAGNRQAMAEAATVTGKSGPANGCQNSGYLADGTALTTGDGPDWFTMPATATALDPPAAWYDFSAGFKETFNATTPGSDGLTPPQRHIQTLLNLMRAPAAPGAKGTTGLPTARLVVYAYLETLLGLARGSGWSAHGLEIPIGEIRRKLSEFGAIPIVLGGQSEILDVGREMRFAPDYMKQAVLARDGGCIYPGCTVPAEHCEFNHIRGWVDGGETSVDNLDAECTGHHHLTHTGESKIVIHNGLPHVILPRYLDPEQKPRRNNYWQGLRPTLF